MEFSVLIKISRLLHRWGLEQRLDSRDTPAFKGRLWVGTVASNHLGLTLWDETSMLRMCWDEGN